MFSPLVLLAQGGAVVEVRDSIGFEKYKNIVYSTYPVNVIEGEGKDVYVVSVQDVKVLGFVNARMTTRYWGSISDEGNFDFKIKQPLWVFLSNGVKLRDLVKDVQDNLDTVFIPAELRENEAYLKSVLVGAFVESL